MIPILVLFLLTFSFFYEKLSSVKRTIVFILCLLFWWFLESFRWESGTDFYNYYNNFNALQISQVRTNRFELGYNFLVLFCRDYLHFTFYVFNSVYYAIIFILYYFSINKATKKPILFLFIFFCFSIGLMGSTRQLMALAIMFFSTIYFLEKKKKWFIISILFASLFHRTIIVCFVFILFTKNIKYKYWLYLIAFAFITQISGLNSIIMEKIILLLPKAFAERFSGYISMPISKNINVRVFTIGIFRRVLPIVLFILYKEKLMALMKNINIQYILNILFFSLFAYILLSFNFTFIISRISIYFIIFEALFYSVLVSIFIKQENYIYASLLAMLFLILAYRGIANYPELFFPYKTIFFTL